ncbi:MAG: efflux RND transporter periplasmic adaptor subunit [Myxococcota bacterium]
MPLSRWRGAIRCALVLTCALWFYSGCKSATAPAPKPAKASAIRADPNDWCKGHALPESMCTKCNPELLEGFKAAGDWCAEHEFPESACPVCNPVAPPPPAGAAAPASSRVGDAADWCPGHALPESMCTKCSPELAGRFKAAGDWCGAHGFPGSACPECNPMIPPRPGDSAPGKATDAGSGAVAPGTRVRFRSPDLERASGIATTSVTSLAMADAVEATARVEFDRNALADVRSAVAGIVREVSVDLGQQVAEGDALFVLESAQVSDLQARQRAARGRVQAARSDLKRQDSLKTSGVASAREVEVARQELAAAQSDLRSIAQSLRISGAGEKAGTGRFTVHAPIAGSVVERPALVGGYAAETDSLARIADTSRMWILLDIAEWDASRVRTGQAVEVRVDGIAGREFTGKLTWVSPEVDPRMRTVAARAEVDNADGLLRAGQFARARVKVEAAATASTVPTSALQRVGDDSVVFVRIAEGVYEPRTVQPGRSDGRAVQVAGNLSPGDAVVTTGAFLLRTELSRESIGAGCCEVDAPGAK